MFNHIKMSSRPDEFDTEFAPGLALGLESLKGMDDDDDMMPEDEEPMEMRDAMEELASLEEMTDLYAVSLETGATTSLTQYALRRELLTGTAMESYSLESFDAEAALEGFGSAVVGKIKDWTARAMNGIKMMVGAGVSRVMALGARIGAMAKRVGASIKGTAMAYPYATAALVVAALAATAAVVAVATGNMPSGAQSKEAVDSAYMKVKESISKIKWPFGKITTSDERPKPNFGAPKAAKMGLGAKIARAGDSIKMTAASAGGWTSTQLKSLLETAMKHINTVGSSLKSFGMMMLKSVKGVIFSKKDTSPAPEDTARIAAKPNFGAPKQGDAPVKGMSMLSSLMRYGHSIFGFVMTIVKDSLSFLMNQASRLMGRGSMPKEADAGAEPAGV